MNSNKNYINLHELLSSKSGKSSVFLQSKCYLRLTGYKEWPVYIKKNSTVFLYSCRESCKELSLLVKKKHFSELLVALGNRMSSSSVGKVAPSIGQRDEERQWKRKAPCLRKGVRWTGWAALFSDSKSSVRC